MFKDRYGKFLTVLLIIGIIAIVILLGYFGYDIYRKYSSNKDAEEAVDAFQEQFANNKNLSNNNNIINNINEINSIDNNIQENNGNNITSNVNNTGNSNTNTKPNNSNSVVKTQYQGYTMLGTIEIPKIKVKLPILKELSTNSLKKATVLLYGDINEVGNFVIIGHNNRNGTIFSNVKKLSSGDKIIVTDCNGMQITYEVYQIFSASPDDTSFWERDTNGLREITLSTCTDNDDSIRTIVLAREI